MASGDIVELWDVYDRDRRKTGRTAVRGEALSDGEYHLVVDIWIRNTSGEYLISRRAPWKPLGGYWEATGGSAIKGDDSLTAALREVQEELGLTLDSHRGKLLFTQRREISGASSFKDIWLFYHDADIAEVRCQPEEVSEARWATAQEIRAMAAQGTLAPSIDYLEQVLAAR